MKIGGGFEILSNIADVRVRVWGKTLQELFQNALGGMASFVKPEVFALKKKSFREKHDIKIEAIDVTSLLIEFLSRVIALSDSVNTVFVEVSFKEFGENFLKGKLVGVKLDDGFEREIKAVSYHEVDITHDQEKGMYETILVFDV
jgi:SHS2 domain-containing protein